MPVTLWASSISATVDCPVPHPTSIPCVSFLAGGELQLLTHHLHHDRVEVRATIAVSAHSRCFGPEVAFHRVRSQPVPRSQSAETRSMNIRTTWLAGAVFAFFNLLLGDYLGSHRHRGTYERAFRRSRSLLFGSFCFFLRRDCFESETGAVLSVDGGP